MEDKKLILINQDGSYNYTSFTLLSDTWTVIGTRSVNVNHKNPFLAVDTLKNQNGEYREKERKVLFNMSVDGKIKPVPESIISSSAPKVTRIKTIKNK